MGKRSRLPLRVIAGLRNNRAVFRVDVTLSEIIWESNRRIGKCFRHHVESLVIQQWILMNNSSGMMGNL